MFTLVRPAIRGMRQNLIRPALFMALIAFCAGCDQSSNHNPAGSPIVQPDSEAGTKAIAQSENLLKLRQSQEAKARNRPKVTPEPE